jgi:hypothetical protein
MRRQQRGQSLVEGTVVMLVFFAMVLGVVDFGQLMFAHQALVERVRTSVRWGTLHPEGGPIAVRNMVLYGTPEQGADPYMRLAEDNIIVSFDALDQDAETLHVEVVNFEAPLFAPWWPGLAHKLVNPRPVSVTAPVVRATAALQQ